MKVPVFASLDLRVCVCPGGVWSKEQAVLGSAADGQAWPKSG